MNLKRLLKFLEVTHVGSTLLEFSLKIAHFAHPNNERFFHNVPFDKKLACITNYREKQSFQWPLVSYKPQASVDLSPAQTEDLMK